MTDLNEHATTIDYQNVVDVYNEISSEYVDHENQSVMCPSCHALLWKANVNILSSSNEEGAFYLCCYNGKVELPDCRQPDETYLELFHGESAMSNDNNSMDDELEKHIVNYLKTMLDLNNHLVQAYRMVRDCFEKNPQLDLKFRIIGKRQHDARQYKLPSSYEVAALIVGDIGDAIDNRDIIVTKQSGSLKRISELHPSYTPLQYPLLHPFGEDGYKVNMLHKNASSSSTAGRKKVTMREFFAYHIQDRPNTFSTMLNGRSLFRKILVEKYTMIEAQRLHLYAVNNMKFDVILTKVYEVCNLLEILIWFGYPDFFMTITCNTNWPEVKRFLKDTTLKSEDRPDILCRLFKIKLDAMIKLVKKLWNIYFIMYVAVVYMIEFQKRGLLHAHICIFMHPGSKIHNPQDVDKFIFAEIPNKYSDPDLYKLVSDHMIHGPCGDANPKCTCMVNKKFSKNFPKMFNDETAVDSQGFPVYKRRDNGQYVVKSDIMMDNRTVVPYNKTLLKQFQAHINVEWCNQDGSIKYLFKYINTGPDRATISLVQNNNGDNADPNLDEMKEFYDCRYISACEASWRIFSFDVHYRIPSCMRLAFHLPGEQQLKNLALMEIENFLISNNSSLRRYQQMSFLDMEAISRATNPLMVEELSYDTETMNNEFNNLFDSLTDEQRGIYNEIMSALINKKGGVYYVYGYGGTGKTYLWKTLSASIRSKGEVVLKVASSSIASLLLEGGRTAHSRFLIPINLTEDSICPVKGNTDVYELLKKTSLIIWDEAPMIHKHAFEALDRTLNDVMNGDSGNTSEAVFGGKVVVFGGDFRQILPVVTNGTRSECVNACINSSYIWSKCKVLKLTKNMRLTAGCRSSGIENIREFADWLLEIGQGNDGGPNDGESVIDIPDDLLILNSVDQMGDLIRLLSGLRMESIRIFRPKQLLSCDDLVMLRELDLLKLANARKELAHLELEAKVSSKVKWLEECSVNPESGSLQL
ncbi:uncharacterized protein LOC143620603 [Bidens hawaiensis]|uniref:uncharacterized protein LOC143620603 n=1 Tax=Bidens hawaiensis TaxID=980011 RepID=UPI00404AEC70